MLILLFSMGKEKTKKKLRNDADKYKQYLEKDRLRKAKIRLGAATKMTDAEEEFKLKEKIRVHNYQQQKRKGLSGGVTSICSPYTTKQATCKALKRITCLLLSSPRK